MLTVLYSSLFQDILLRNIYSAVLKQIYMRYLIYFLQYLPAANTNLERGKVSLYAPTWLSRWINVCSKWW